MFKFLSTVLIALLLNSGAMFAQAPIALTTRIPMTSAPGYFRLQINVPYNENNRQVCLEMQQVQNGSYYRKSCWAHADTFVPITVNGQTVEQRKTPPQTTWQMVKELNAGRYIARVSLQRNDDTWVSSVPLTLRVTGFGYESEPEL